MLSSSACLGEVCDKSTTSLGEVRVMEFDNEHDKRTLAARGGADHNEFPRDVICITSRERVFRVFVELNNSTNLIDAVHNKSALWDTTTNFSEEEKEPYFMSENG